MEANRPTIVVAEGLSDAGMARLRSAGEVRVLPMCDRASLMSAVADCDALVVRSYARVTAAVIEAGARLRVIGRAGVGLENIDVSAARARGVTVVYTPAAATNAVAEHTVGLMLSLERRVVAGDAMVRAGRFLEARRSFVSRDLRGLVLGVVGMGRIGSAVGRICAGGLGMRVIYNDVRPVGTPPFAAEAVDKRRLWAESDVVTLHVPLTDETRGMMDATVFECMKTSATLVNTSRGGVVDGVALAAALRTGRPAGAAIDVHDPEPPEAGDPLLTAPNCLLSPHVASRTTSGLARMNDVVDDVIAVLRGASPSYPAWSGGGAGDA